jgi:hypothetical protein
MSSLRKLVAVCCRCSRIEFPPQVGSCLLPLQLLFVSLPSACSSVRKLVAVCCRRSSCCVLALSMQFPPDLVAVQWWRPPPLLLLCRCRLHEVCFMSEAVCRPKCTCLDLTQRGALMGSTCLESTLHFGVRSKLLKGLLQAAYDYLQQLQRSPGENLCSTSFPHPPNPRTRPSDVDPKLSEVTHLPFATMEP